MLNQSPQLDRIFHALSDPTRRAVLDRLTQGPASVSELAAPFGTTLAAIVQHVQVLEASGLISTEKIGRTRTCRVSADAIVCAEQWLSERRKVWEARLDRMEAYVLKLQAAEKKRGKRKHRK
ncbi:MAG TPA: metalloregulator ArsR/SmtB family transcription factor [Steroidobacteraceae bacterium]|jgi:DNA-binding transcriptional ArsR family regulator